MDGGRSGAGWERGGPDPTNVIICRGQPQAEAAVARVSGGIGVMVLPTPSLERGKL